MSELNVQPGEFYRDRRDNLWCCYDRRSHPNHNDFSKREHRAYCILVCGADGTRFYENRTETFFVDGRYDAEGKRDYCLVKKVSPPRYYL